MPTVSIEMFRGRTRQQKERLAASVTAAVVESLGVEPGLVKVKLYELDPGHSATGGVLGPESPGTDA